jgi:hypothetical protein
VLSPINIRDFARQPYWACPRSISGKSFMIKILGPSLVNSE